MKRFFVCFWKDSTFDNFVRSLRRGQKGAWMFFLSAALIAAIMVYVECKKKGYP